MPSKKLIDVVPVQFRGKSKQIIKQKIDEGVLFKLAYCDSSGNILCRCRIIKVENELYVRDDDHNLYFSSCSRQRGHIFPGSSNTFNDYFSFENNMTYGELIRS